MIDYEELFDRADKGSACFMKSKLYHFLGDSNDGVQPGRMHALVFAQSDRFNMAYVVRHVYFRLHDDLKIVTRYRNKQLKNVNPILAGAIDDENNWLARDFGDSRYDDSTVVDLLDPLDEQERLIAIRYAEGYSYREIAEELGLTIYFVYKALAKIRKKIKLDRNA